MTCFPFTFELMKRLYWGKRRHWRPAQDNVRRVGAAAVQDSVAGSQYRWRVDKAHCSRDRTVFRNERTISERNKLILVAGKRRNTDEMMSIAVLKRKFGNYMDTRLWRGFCVGALLFFLLSSLRMQLSGWNRVRGIRLCRMQELWDIPYQWLTACAIFEWYRHKAEKTIDLGRYAVQPQVQLRQSEYHAEGKWD